MKIVNEPKKENLLSEFINNFISKSWEEVSNLKTNIFGLKQGFTSTENVESILNELIDAYYIAIGQLQNLDSSAAKNNGNNLENTINKLIIDEKEAVEGYADAIEELKDTENFVNIEKVLKHISDEEEEHISELSEIIDDEKNIDDIELFDEEDKTEDNFFNADFEEPEIEENSEFSKWQLKNNK